MMSLDEEDKEYMPHVTFMEYFSYILGEGLLCSEWNMCI